ncbi:MAG TPA: T9SS type A sorting domain-containing protein, partial [Bacteroidota bacterium]|nr:T9SS type A sorting domain-containing protein [Bacteroidota bacterium]
ADDFAFSLVAPQSVPVSIKFGAVSTGAVVDSLGDTLTTWFNTNVVNSPTIPSGKMIKVVGRGVKGSIMKASYTWATLPKATKGKVSTFIYNILRLPMPNRINALMEAFADNGGFTGGLLVGKVYTNLDSIKEYGWLLSAKYTDALKTIIDKSGVQSGAPHGFDTYFMSAKPVLKGQKSLPPLKFNDVLLGDLIALKINIAASTIGITPHGFGELTYDDGGSNPFNGTMVRDLSTIADSLMMGWQVDSTYTKNSKFVTVAVHHFVSSSVFKSLDSVVANINAAFEGKLDTVKFSDSTQFRGTRKLTTVSYMHLTPSVIPAHIVPNANIVPQIPMAYALYQNYPNPFNPTTTIQFALPVDGIVTLKIYNILGQEVATLYNHELMTAGIKNVTFNALAYASGVYLYRIEATSIGDVSNTFLQVKKMILVK